MKIVLEEKESEEIFYNAMCNGLGYLGGYGLSLDYLSKDYKKAKNALVKESVGKTVCFEDVLMKILKTGGKLKFINMSPVDGEYTRTISLKEVHERVQLSPANHLLDMINECDDAITADCILQSVIYKEVVFG